MKTQAPSTDASNHSREDNPIKFSYFNQVCEVLQ